MLTKQPSRRPSLYDVCAAIDQVNATISQPLAATPPVETTGRVAKQGRSWTIPILLLVVAVLGVVVAVLAFTR
jgi:hypothetical protein